jgi:hypothetical protein
MIIALRKMIQEDPSLHFTYDKEVAQTVIKGMGELLNKFQWIYSEVNFKECYLGGALIDELDQYLLSFGFHRIETGNIVGETWTDALYIKLFNK